MRQIGAICKKCLGKGTKYKKHYWIILQGSQLLRLPFPFYSICFLNFDNRSVKDLSICLKYGSPSGFILLCLSTFFWSSMLCLWQDLELEEKVSYFQIVKFLESTTILCLNSNQQRGYQTLQRSFIVWFRLSSKSKW